MCFGGSSGPKPQKIAPAPPAPSENPQNSPVVGEDRNRVTRPAATNLMRLRTNLSGIALPGGQPGNGLGLGIQIGG